MFAVNRLQYLWTSIHENSLSGWSLLSSRSWMSKFCINSPYTNFSLGLTSYSNQVNSSFFLQPGLVIFQTGQKCFCGNSVPVSSLHLWAIAPPFWWQCYARMNGCSRDIQPGFHDYHIFGMLSNISFWPVDISHPRDKWSWRTRLRGLHRSLFSDCPTTYRPGTRFVLEPSFLGTNG